MCYGNKLTIHVSPELSWLLIGLFLGKLQCQYSAEGEFFLNIFETFGHLYISGGDERCFSNSSVVKNLPRFRKIPWRMVWQPTPVFLPGKSHGQRRLAGYSPWGLKRVGHDLVTKQQALGNCSFHPGCHIYVYNVIHYILLLSV